MDRLQNMAARREAIARAAVNNMAALRALYPYLLANHWRYELRRDAARSYVILDSIQGLIVDRRRGLGGARELGRRMVSLANGSI